MDTPGTVAGKNDIVSPCEINRLAIGADGLAFYAVDTAWGDNATGKKALYKSVDGGRSWHDEIGVYLYNAMSPAEKANFCIWNIDVPSDNSSYLAVITGNSATRLPRNIWISQDGGLTWNNTRLNSNSNLSAVAVSPLCGNDRCVAAATRTGSGNGGLLITNSALAYNWRDQKLPGDVLTIRYSPQYLNDNMLAAVFSDVGGTYMTAGLHDVVANITDWSALYGSGPVEVVFPINGHSPRADQIISADLELPGDFQGQIPGRRKFFISVDSPGTNAGIYRVDNTEVIQLMKSTPDTRIGDIAFNGDIRKGKLLAGSVRGDGRSATVMTWFTDTPWICGAPCWHKAVKPATGAGGHDTCSGNKCANALVNWAPDGLVAYAATGSTDNLTGGANWPLPYFVGLAQDESAFSVSADNGKTWNQTALIDTYINSFTDIAPSPDDAVVYLASMNNAAVCPGFDSVWRYTTSSAQNGWERVLCARAATGNCTSAQSNAAILRMAGDRPSGDMLLWAAQGTRAVKWTADRGDTWLNINTDTAVQDIAFEDSGVLYVLAPEGIVYRYKNPSGAWNCDRITVSGITPAYSICAAYCGLTPDNDRGTVIVGGTGAGEFDVAYSSDFGASFTPVCKPLPVRGNTLVMASSGYRSDGYVLAINSTGMYAFSVYTGQTNWEEWWGGAAWPDPVTGLALTRNYSFYFATAATWGSATPYVRFSAATAGFDPSVSLGTAGQPATRFRASGGMELNQPVTVYAIDQRDYAPPAGGVWRYVDDLLWSGPRPSSPVSHFRVNCDPVTGRAGNIELKWLPKSLARGYNIHIARDIDFTLIVAKIGDDYFGPYYTPYDLDQPALYIPPGGGMVSDANGNTWEVPPLEAGRSYYWRVKVQDVASGDCIKSPWSWRESFVVMPGFKVTTPYPGTQLLSPKNGCVECPLKPAFSWSPYQGADNYEFTLSRQPDMSAPIFSCRTTGTACLCSEELEAGKDYYWRVRALSRDGKPVSAYSATFCFKTAGSFIYSDETEQAANAPNWVWMIFSLLIVLLAGTVLMLIWLR